MYKYLLLLIFVSQNCFSGNASDYCTDEMIHQYSLALRKEINSKIIYPPVALRRGLEGEVVFNFTLLDGVITDKEIIEAAWCSSDNVITEKEVIKSTCYRYPVFDSILLSSTHIEDLPQLLCKTKPEKKNVISKITFSLGPKLDSELSSLTHPSSGTGENALR
jgi:hypothetical protein